MPALPPVPQTLRLDFHYVISLDLHSKTHYFYRYSGTAPTTTDLNNMATAVRTSYLGNVAGLHHSSATLNDVTITDLSSPTSSVGVNSTDVAGTRVGLELPASACVLQSLRVARRFRGGHYRVYWPFGVRDDLANGQEWITGFLTVVNAGLASFDTGIKAAVWPGGGTLGSVGVSYYQGFTTHTGVTGRPRAVSTPRVTPVVDPITAASIAVRVASQRKRMLAK